MTNKTTPYMLAIIAIIAMVGIVLSLQNSAFSLNQDFIGQVIRQVYTIGGTVIGGTVTVTTCSEETEAEDCDGYACVSNRCRTTCRTDNDCAEGYFCLVKSSRGGECYEESEEGYTAGGTVYGVAQFDIFEHTIDEYLLFQLHTLESAVYEDDYWLTSLTEESLYRQQATKIEGVSNILQTDFKYLVFLTYREGTRKKSYILFPDAAVLRPSNWIIISATVEIESGHARDHSVILSKQTKDCNTPLYAFTTQNGKYHFIISVDGEKYKLSSDTAIASGIERRLLGVFDGTQIKFYVDDVLEASARVEGRMSAASDSFHLAFGRSTVCNAYQLRGQIEDVYIWGE